MRRHVIELLESAQHTPGQREHFLSVAEPLLLQGLEQTGAGPDRVRWLQSSWLYYFLREDYDHALASLEQAVPMLPDAEHSLIANVYNNLAYTLLLVGRIADAKYYLRHAVVAATQQRDQKQLADTYYGVGDAYQRSGELSVARRYFEAATEIDELRGDELNVMSGKLKLGTLARAAGEIDAAIAMHELALNYYENTGRYREIVARVELAYDHLANENLATAQEYATSALADERTMTEQRIDSLLASLQILNLRFSAGEQVNTQEILDHIYEIERLLLVDQAPQKTEINRPFRRFETFRTSRSVFRS